MQAQQNNMADSRTSSHCIPYPPLAPSLLSSILPSLPAPRRPIQWTPYVCLASCTVLCIHLAIRDTETMGCSRQKKVSFQWPAVTFSERAPTTNPFLTKNKLSDVRHVQRIRHKDGRRSYLSVGVGSDSQSLLD